MTSAVSSVDKSSDAQRPWYQDGLRFACTGCGGCCTGHGFVWVDDAEIDALAEHQGRAAGEVRLLDTRPVQGRVTLREHANGDCIYLDGRTRRCTVYEARPRQCRTWPFWQSNLRSEEDWQRAGEDCPGIDRGELVPLEVITARADDERL